MNGFHARNQFLCGIIEYIHIRPFNKVINLGIGGMYPPNVHLLKLLGLIGEKDVNSTSVLNDVT